MEKDNNSRTGMEQVNKGCATGTGQSQGRETERGEGKDEKERGEGERKEGREGKSEQCTLCQEGTANSLNFGARYMPTLGVYMIHFSNSCYDFNSH